MSPQPRPRSKDPRPAGDGEREVLTPDQVWDDEGDEVPAAPLGRPDRRPLWALIAGITAFWFSFNGIAIVFLPLALIAPFAIYYGWRTRQRVQREDGPARARRQATWGFGLGIVATVLILAQIVYIVAFFEWDKTDGDLELTTEGPETTEATTPTPTTEAPAPSSTLG